MLYTCYLLSPLLGTGMLSSDKRVDGWLLADRPGVVGWLLTAGLGVVEWLLTAGPGVVVRWDGS